MITYASVSRPPRSPKENLVMVFARLRPLLPLLSTSVLTTLFQDSKYEVRADRIACVTTWSAVVLALGGRAVRSEVSSFWM